jgi:hypothetical protein
VHRTARSLGRIGTAVQKGLWDMTADQANAYYSPELNKIVIPGGILSPPFFDGQLPTAFNFGTFPAHFIQRSLTLAQAPSAPSSVTKLPTGLTIRAASTTLLARARIGGATRARALSRKKRSVLSITSRPLARTATTRLGKTWPIPAASTIPSRRKASRFLQCHFVTFCAGTRASARRTPSRPPACRCRCRITSCFSWRLRSFGVQK